MSSATRVSTGLYRPPRSAWLALIVFVAAAARAEPARARAGGIVADSCDGCHGGGGGGPPNLTLTPDRATFNPGDSVTFTLTIQWPSIRVGGAFITTGGVGTLRALAGEGLAVNAQGLTHTAPKSAVGDTVTFHFAWQAPSTPGGVDFRIAALAGNGNNAPSGDSPGAGEFQWVFGCTSRTFYLDLDRDGYGAKDLGIRLGCTSEQPPTGYASMDGDCDENDEKVHPGATEICNMKDDNCDGQIDENAPAVTMWPDRDGDGYYGLQTGNPKVGCGDIAGYAPRGGDCDDTDPMINPGASEICNNKDDNCNGEVDERVRPQCGVGWCARYSASCDPADCRPGPPAKEVCNSFDDDCDGQNDNDACPMGMLCSGSQCVPNGSASTGSAADSASGTGSTNGAGTASSTGAASSGSGASGSDAGAATETASSGARGGASGNSGGEQPTSGCAVAASTERSANRRSAGRSWGALALIWLAVRRARRRLTAA